MDTSMGSFIPLLIPAIAGMGALAHFGGNDNLTLHAREPLGIPMMKTIRLVVEVGYVDMWSWLM